MLHVENLDMHPDRTLRLYPSKATTFEYQRRFRTSTTTPGFQALAMLRLVSKTICCSASRLYFRDIRVSFRRSDGSETLMKLEDLSNGLWATDVRKLNIWFATEFIEGMNRHSTKFHDFFERLRSLFMKLPNLEAFNLYPFIYGNRYENFIKMALNTVQSLPPRRLTELEILHHYTSYCSTKEFLPTETDPGTSTGGLENLKHLGLKGHFTYEEESELGLLQLIQSAVNIESLRLQHYCSGVPNTLQFISPRRLRYLQLENGSISAREVIHLLKNCKESIRYIRSSAVPHPGSWLQLLFQMGRSLKLFNFCFRLPRPDVNDRKIEELEKGLRQNIRDENILCVYAHSDIQRQVNANRLAAGLIPYEGNVDVETPPLKSVMEEAQPRAMITWMLWNLDIFGYSNDYDLHDNETQSGVLVQSYVKNS